MGAAFLQNLVVVMVVAAAATLLAQRLRQPVVLGYILAGVLVGPHTPWSLVSDPERIHSLAELGLIFLLFSLGLEFNFQKVQRVGATAVVVAVLEIAAMLGLGFGLGQLFGWSVWDSVFLGAILSVSSTTIIVKVLMEQGKVHEEFAEVAFGILVVEDLLAVVMAAILSAGGQDFGATAATGLWIVVYSIVGAGVGLTLIPRFVEAVSRRHSEEVLVVTVVGLAFASALIAKNLGFSLALGAFIMGALIGESRAVRKVEHKVAPIRDLFSSTFFVAVGMLLDPVLVWEHRFAVLAITAVAVVGKIVACAITTWIAGREPVTALRVGFAMGQIGEFSFILAGVGLTLGVTSPHLYPIAVAVCALTTFTTPYLMMSSEALVRTFERSRLARAGESYRRLLEEARGPTRPPASGRPGLRAVVASGWAFATVLALIGAADILSGRVGWESGAVDAAAVFGTGLFLGFPAVMFQRAAREIAVSRGKRRTLRHLAGPGWVRKAGLRPGADLVAHGATLGLVAASFVLAFQAMPTARPPTPLLLGALVAAFGVLAVLRGHFFFLARRAEGLALAALPAEVAPGPLERLRASAPWGVDATEIVVADTSPAAYSALGELDLRRRTGAIAAFVSRGGERIPAPDPDLGLLPGDRLILIGRHDQLERARHMLQAEVRRPVARREALGPN
ncbi:MAG TPA: cation:proton antiporter [Candidatus Thermoplasmatota archaeon]|nr:cation:proton antiporter [Candidatus Thermoplasmatota archaeon]